MGHAQVWERIRQHVPAAWFMLDLVDMEHFIQDYAGYAVRVAKGLQDGCTRLSVHDYYPIWLQMVRDSARDEKVTS